MNEDYLTSIFPKKIRRPKTASKTKLSLKDKIKKSLPDYLYIMNQIKEKKNYMNSHSLLHKYLHNNETKRIKSSRYKFINSNEPTALITETINNRQKLSYKNMSTKSTVTDSFHKNKLKLNRKTETPKRFLNEIIKFEDKKKLISKPHLFVQKDPIKITHNYKYYLNKVNIINFRQFSNAKTEFAHKIRSEFFLNKFDETSKKENLRNKKFLLMEKERIENEKELRDKVYYPSLDLQKISKQIKLILANEYKFNQLEIHEQFFESYTNRINFLFDNFKPPYIKNNLIKIKYDKTNYENNYFEWKWMNALGINALNYLSRAKIKIQRENDERMKFLREKNKIKKRYIYYKKLSTNNIYNSKSQIEKIIYKKYYAQNDENKNVEKENESFDEGLENKDYFTNKIEKYDMINIAEPKCRNFIFNYVNNIGKDNKNIIY